MYGLGQAVTPGEKMSRTGEAMTRAVAIAGIMTLAGCLVAPSDEPGGPTAPTETPSTSEADPSPAAPATTPITPPTPSPDGAIATGQATAVIDGDTIEVDGVTVRLIGMDSPEQGACGFAEATAAMSAMVTGQAVTLVAVPGRDDTDKYGRLLRYVDVGGVDAGRREIELGLAIARYDGRDGYGEHPRQADYITADGAAPDVTCATTAAPPAPAPVVGPAPAASPAPAGNCDPSYPDVCIPPSPPDLDCGDVSFRRFRVLEPDPHQFDGDHNGVGCEGG